MMWQNDGTALPKGMTLPVDVVYPAVKDETVTHDDVNYSGLIRKALNNIEGVSVKIVSLTVQEDVDAASRVTLELEVRK